MSEQRKFFHQQHREISESFACVVCALKKSRAKVKTKHDRAELRMRALKFTADRAVSYSRQFRGKNLTRNQFSSSDERNSTPRSSTFVVEPLTE
jgi:hypothetical protein